jgi:hypothetical protein
MKEYGFVYIWYDKKHSRYYIGRHWGNVEDGYVCSSSWMKQAYKRRPKDFKRRILKIVNSNKRDLVLEEDKWLSLIREDELGSRYYNLHNKNHLVWHDHDNTRKSVGQKISSSLKGRKLTEEHKSNIKSSHRKNGLNWGWNKGRKYSLEEIESRKKNRKEPWNKGLSKNDDARVKQYIENSAKTRREKSKK